MAARFRSVSRRSSRSTRRSWPARCGCSGPSGSGARIHNSQLLRGTQEIVDTLRRAPAGRRHRGQWRRAARFETVMQPCLDMNNACKRRCSNPSGRRKAPRFTTSATARSSTPQLSSPRPVATSGASTGIAGARISITATPTGITTRRAGNHARFDAAIAPPAHTARAAGRLAAADSARRHAARAPTGGRRSPKQQSVHLPLVHR